MSQQTRHRIFPPHLAVWLLALFTLVAFYSGTLRAADSKVLTIAEIIALPESSALNGRPVVTRGILTYHEPGHRMAFLQDQTAAIYVHIAGKQDVSPGDYVEVRGILDPGLKGRNIRGPNFDTSPSIRRLSAGSFPEPLRLQSLDGIERQLGARWTRASIEVKAVALEGDRARLILKDHPHLPVFIAGVTRPSMLPNHLAGLAVEVDGVIADSPISGKPLVMQRQILISGLEFVHIPQDEIDRQFTLPESGLSDLRWLPEREGPEIRARVTGTVTWVKPGEGFFLQKGTMAAWIQSTSHLSPDLGQSVECAGRPSSYQGAGILNAAIWREFPAGQANQQATPFEHGFFESDESQGKLTVVAGTLVEVFRSPSEDLAIIETGSDLVFCHLSEPSGAGRLPQLEKGSGVSMSGVFLNRPSPALPAADTQGSYHLLLRKADDVRLVSTPPFWNHRRLLMLLAALVATALLAGIWVLALRRKVRKQEGIIRKTVAKQVVEEERVRIAREWHDSFEQHFAGLTMLLDATAAVVPPDSPAGGMLGRAARMADHSRSEARQAIWDLRSSGLKRDVPFAEELEESLRLSWPDDAGCKLEITCHEHQLAPSRAVSLHLLRIVHEAVTNALKHARCGTISVTWEKPDAATVVLSIQDDGRGISQGVLDQASREGHFGLMGMRERSLRLQALLQILSPSPSGSHGTLIRVTIPISNLKS